MSNCPLVVKYQIGFPFLAKSRKTGQSHFMKQFPLAWNIRKYTEYRLAISAGLLLVWWVAGLSDATCE
jgi:hypothetical protein